MVWSCEYDNALCQLKIISRKERKLGRAKSRNIYTKKIPWEKREKDHEKNICLR
jgi:ribosomal protein S21